MNIKNDELINSLLLNFGIDDEKLIVMRVFSFVNFFKPYDVSSTYIIYQIILYQNPVKVLNLMYNNHSD